MPKLNNQDSNTKALIEHIRYLQDEVRECREELRRYSIKSSRLENTVEQIDKDMDRKVRTASPVMVLLTMLIYITIVALTVLGVLSLTN